MTKSGKGDDKKMAPNSRLLELCVGYSTIPAPGSLSEVFQDAIATCDAIGSLILSEKGTIMAFPPTIWFKSRMRDNELKLFWLAALAFGS